jgi:GrpB-like predicted nucleotidyltransferase (UPF0157 family)
MDSLRLMSYNTLWPQEFEQSRSMILHASDGWLHEVQHIGSTYHQDGVAQPIIDMMAAMRDLQGLNEAATLIEGLNFARVEAPQWCEDEFVAMLQKPRHGPATHTLLITKLNGNAWSRSLAIRRWLSENLCDWQRFQNLKRDCFSSGCGAYDRYAAEKLEFFANLERQIASSQE